MKMMTAQISGGLLSEADDKTESGFFFFIIREAPKTTDLDFDYSLTE